MAPAKEQAIAEGIIEVVTFAVRRSTAPILPLGSQSGYSTGHHGIRLLERAHSAASDPCAATIEGVAYPALLDRSPIAQMEVQLVATSTSGLLAHSFCGSLHPCITSTCPKRYPPLLSKTTASADALSNAKRSKAFRLFRVPPPLPQVQSRNASPSPPPTTAPPLPRAAAAAAARATRVVARGGGGDDDDGGNDAGGYDSSRAAAPRASGPTVQQAERRR